MIDSRAEEIYKALSTWFAENSRKLPWRENRSAYRVWISEIMLQQTQVATVIPYYERWMESWPSLSLLAEATEDEVLKAWEGLGYYSRARNILKTARMLASQGEKDLPLTFHELIKLPGIGPYTAGAIASLAAEERVPAVDGNVLRVVSRLNAAAWQASNAKDQRACRDVLQNCMDHLAEISAKSGGKRPFSPAVFNEALIELGALLCRPGEASCSSCPLSRMCRAHLEDAVTNYPIPAKRGKISRESYTVLICRNEDGCLAVRKRAGSGLLASLWEFPMLDGRREKDEVLNLAEDLGFVPVFIKELRPLRHVFSHLIWEMNVFYLELSRADIAENEAVYAEDGDGTPGSEPLPRELMWLPAEEVKELAFSSALSSLRDFYCL